MHAIWQQSTRQPWPAPLPPPPNVGLLLLPVWWLMHDGVTGHNTCSTSEKSHARSFGCSHHSSQGAWVWEGPVISMAATGYLAERKPFKLIRSVDSSSNLAYLRAVGGAADFSAPSQQFATNPTQIIVNAAFYQFYCARAAVRQLSSALSSRADPSGTTTAFSLVYSSLSLRYPLPRPTELPPSFRLSWEGRQAASWIVPHPGQPPAAAAVLVLVSGGLEGGPSESIHRPKGISQQPTGGSLHVRKAAVCSIEVYAFAAGSQHNLGVPQAPPTHLSVMAAAPEQDGLIFQLCTNA